MPDPPRRWRLEGVPLVSGRGVAGLVALTLLFATTIGPYLFQLVVVLLTQRPPEITSLTATRLYFDMAFKLLTMVGLPIAYVTLVRPSVPWPRELRLGLSVRTPWFVLFGVISMIIGTIVLYAILYLLTYAGLLSDEPSPLVEAIQGLLSWPLVVLLSLVAALSEETLFRGLLQPRLGLVATSLLFGLVHVSYGTWLQILAPLLLGFFFGVLVRWTGSLWTAIAAHFTFDFINLSILYLLKQPGPVAAMVFCMGSPSTG